MKTPNKIISLACMMVMCLLLITAGEINAQVIKMSAKDLTELSTAVLYGKCTGKRCEWNENRSIIYTYVTVAPEEYIKGNLGSEAVVAVPGGQVDNIIYEVSEMPVFTEGEEVMLFIWKNPSGKNLVTGGHLGKMKIEKDAKTGKRMVHGYDIAEEDESGEDQEIDNPNRQAKPEKVKLEDFVVKLKGYAKN